MSDLHFFQRYSQPENQVTNNTLQLFAQLYRDSPGRLEDLLGRLIDGISVDVGVKMQQQTSEQSSVPDGGLTQQSFRIVLETKTGDSYSTDQLERHLDAFQNEEQRILLLLTPHGLDEAEKTKVEKKLEEKDEGLTFAAVKFSDIVDALIGGARGDKGDPLVSEYEQDLYELVVDYQNYCSGRDLLPDDDLLYAVPCGETHELNLEYDLYYHPRSRGYQKHDYVGIYHDLSIRAIGKLKRTVQADLIDGELKGQGVEQLTEDQRKRILGAMEAAPEMVGYPIEKDLEFLLVDEFYETDFEKTSKYGMRGPQYFNLRDHIDVGESENLPPTEDIARQLKGAEWK